MVDSDDDNGDGGSFVIDGVWDEIDDLPSHFMPWWITP